MIPATGEHDFTAQIETEDYLNEAATCTAPATYFYACSVCGEKGTQTYGYGSPNGHTDGEPKKENENAATCTANGSYEIVVYCAVCGEELSREGFTIPAGHSAGEPVTENENPATCTANGSYDVVVYCTECGVEISRTTNTVEALGHKWDKGVVTAATCVAAGKKVYTCTVCGNTREETLAIDPLNHVGTEVRNKVEPTKDANGYSGDIYCTGCGELLQRGKVVKYNEGYCPYCGGHHTGVLGAVITAIHGILWLFHKAFRLI